jgi:hypothetical protein
VEVSQAAPADLHPWRCALVLSALLVVAGGVMTFLSGLWSGVPGSWMVPGDVWVSIPAAHYVADGALPSLYTQNHYPYTPGLPMLLAPVAWVGWNWRLGESIPFSLPHPTLWLLLAPYGIGITSTAALVAVRRLLGALGRRAGAAALQAAVAIVALVPLAVIYAHYEDVVATAALLVCAALCIRRRWIAAAVALSIAILFKQWALLAVPIVVVWAPPRVRFRVAWYSVLIPGALVALCLALDWSNASTALTSARATPHLGHHQVWVTDTSGLILGAPLRVGSFVLAGIVAWWLRDARDPSVMVAGFGAVLVGRLLFEPTLFAYYLAPSLAFVLVFAFAAAPPDSRRWLVTAGLAVSLDLWFALHPPLLVWWAVALGLAVAVYGPSVRAVVRRSGNATASHLLERPSRVTVPPIARPVASASD